MEFKRRAFGMVGYMADWVGYGSSYDYRDNAEFFATLEDARWEMYSRSRGDGYTSYIEFDECGYITGVKEREYTLTPGTWDSQYMSLRPIHYNDAGELVYSDEPSHIVEIGPRGAAVVGRY